MAGGRQRRECKLVDALVLSRLPAFLGVELARLMQHVHHEHLALHDDRVPRVLLVRASQADTHPVGGGQPHLVMG